MLILDGNPKLIHENVIVFVTIIGTILLTYKVTHKMIEKHVALFVYRVTNRLKKRKQLKRYLEKFNDIRGGQLRPEDVKEICLRKDEIMRINDPRIIEILNKLLEAQQFSLTRSIKKQIFKGLKTLSYICYNSTPQKLYNPGELRKKMVLGKLTTKIKDILIDEKLYLVALTMLANEAGFQIIQLLPVNFQDRLFNLVVRKMLRYVAATMLGLATTALVAELIALTPYAVFAPYFAVLLKTTSFVSTVVLVYNNYLGFLPPNNFILAGNCPKHLERLVRSGDRFFDFSKTNSPISYYVEPTDCSASIYREKTDFPEDLLSTEARKEAFVKVISSSGKDKFAVKVDVIDVEFTTSKKESSSKGSKLSESKASTSESKPMNGKKDYSSRGSKLSGSKSNSRYSDKKPSRQKKPSKMVTLADLKKNDPVTPEVSENENSYSKSKGKEPEIKVRNNDRQDDL
jgi:hypothetical protein